MPKTAEYVSRINRETVATEVGELIGDGCRVVLVGETNHQSQKQHQIECEMLPSLAKSGFTILALEGIAPTINAELAELKRDFCETRSDEKVLQFVDKNWSDSAGDVSNMVGVLCQAFNLDMEVVGIDMDQDKLKAMIPRLDMEAMWLTEFPDENERQDAVKIFKGESKMPEKPTMDDIVRLQGLISRITNMMQTHVQANAEKTREFIDKTIVNDRSLEMSQNMNELLAREENPKVVSFMGATHVEWRPESETSFIGGNINTVTITLVEPDDQTQITNGYYTTDTDDWIRIIN